MTPAMTVKGLQEAQRGMEKHLAVFKPRGPLEKIVWLGTTMAHRYAVAFTHVDSGALRSAHMMKMEGGFLGSPRGVVYINPSATSIVRQRGRRITTLHATGPATYGPFEHKRGGSHAFYERVQSERGSQIGRNMAYQLISEMQRAR